MIPQIQPNCMEIIDTSTVAFACTNGFYLGKFENQSSVELMELPEEGSYSDVVYFPYTKCIYTYN